MNIKIIETILLLFGYINIFSSVMWILTTPNDHWLWFSRFSMGIISIGLYAILKKMDHVEKTK